MAIRTAAKALIIHDGKILLNFCEDGRNGEYYALPGGGQNQYEALEDTVVRECLEETGYRVAPVRYAATYEEICTTQYHREKYPDYSHKIGHVFICKLESDEKAAPTEPDTEQKGSEWIDLNRIHEIRILPQAIADHFNEIVFEGKTTFLGTEFLEYNHG